MVFDPSIIVSPNRYNIFSKPSVRPGTALTKEPAFVNVSQDVGIIDALGNHPNTLLFINSFNDTDGNTVIVDRSQYKHEITVTQSDGVCEHSTDFTFFDSASSIYNYGALGTGGYMSIPDNPMWDWNSDFTIHFWLMIPTGTGSNRCIMSHCTSSVTTSSFYMFSDTDSIYVRIYYSTGVYVTSVLASSANRDGLWHHYAWVRKGGYFYGFCDGNLTGSVATVTVISCANPVRIGYNQTEYGTYQLIGYLQNIVFSNVGLWDSAFDPIPRTDFIPSKNYAIVDQDNNQYPIEVMSFKRGLDPDNQWTGDDVDGSTLNPEVGTVTGALTNMSQTEGGQFTNYIAGGLITGVIRNLTFSANFYFTSLSCWFKCISGHSGQDFLWYRDASRVMFVASGGALTVYNGSANVTWNHTISDYNWHHLVIVEGTDNNTHWAYLDGVKSSAEITTNFAGYMRFWGKSAALSGHAVGDFADGRAYSHVITERMIDEMIAAGSPHIEKEMRFKIAPDFATDSDLNLSLVWDETQESNHGRDVHENCVLLIQSDNEADDYTTFIDYSPVARKVSIHAGSPVHDTAEQILSLSTIRIPSGTAGLSVPNSDDFAFGTGDFTLRCWIKWYAWSTSYEGGTLFSFRNSTSYGWEVAYDSSLGFMFITSSAASGVDNTSSGAESLSLDTWYYFECTRTSGTLRFFLDGTYIGGGAHAESADNPGSYPFVIGYRQGWSPTEYNFDGWMQGIEVIKGWSARTSTASYNVPVDGVVQGYVGTPIYKEEFTAVYNFEQDPSSEDLLDSTTNGNDGTVVGTMTLSDRVDGFVGKGWDLDGTDDGATTASALGITDYSFTFFAYFIVDDLTSENPLISGDDASNYIGLSVIIGTSGEVIVRLGDGTGVTSADYYEWTSANDMIQEGADYTIAVVLTSFTTPTLYVNRLEKTLTAGAATGASADLTNALYRVGTSAADSTFFDGKIYDWFMYADEASADQVAIWHFSSIDGIWSYDFAWYGIEPYKVKITLPAVTTETSALAVPIYLNKRSSLSGFDVRHIFTTLKDVQYHINTEGSPVSHWTVDDTDGTYVYDEYGINDLTYTNMTPTAGGKFANYMSGGLVTSVIRTLDLGALTSFKSVTLWIRRTNLGYQSTIISKNPQTYRVYVEWSGQSNVIRVYNGSTATTIHSITETTDWHHIAIVEGSTTNYHWVYLDGVKDSSERLTNFAGVFRNFGFFVTSGSGETPHMSNMKLFDYKLTDAEVLADSQLNPWSKIHITDVNSVELNAEVDYWDSDTEEAAIIVNPTHYTKETELILDYNPSNSLNTAIGVVGDSAAQAVYPSAYKSRWGFNQDPSVDDLLDSTSNAADGTMGGTMLTEDLVFADRFFGWDFEGTDDVADIASNLGLTSYPIVIGGRFKVDDLDNNQPIISGNDASNFIGLTIFINTNGQFVLSYGDGTGITSSDKKNYGTAVSSMSAGTYDFVLYITAFGTQTLWINGEAISISPITGSGVSVDLSNASYIIGVDLANSVYLDGTIYDLWAYAGTFSSELASIYTAGITDSLVSFENVFLPFPPPPAAWQKPRNMFAGFPVQSNCNVMFPNNILIPRFRLIPRHTTFGGGGNNGSL